MPQLRSLALRLDTPLVRGVVFGAAALGFGLGLWWSLRQEPGLLGRLHLGPAALVLLALVPLQQALNALEFLLSAKLLGRRIRFAVALQVSIAASAANLLPIPGATLVRVAGLRASGATLKGSSAATALVAILWGAVSFAVAGAGLLATRGSAPAGAALLALALLLFAAAGFVARRMRARSPVPRLLALCKAAMVATDVSRLYFCFLALGVSASLAQAAGLAASAFLGSAASIVPQGLGIREAASALIAPAVGLEPARAFLCTLLNRVLGLIAVLPLTVALALLQRKVRGEGEVSDPAEVEGSEER